MPDEISNPLNSPEKAAMQIVVELIRAERVPMTSGNANGILAIFDQALEHFKNLDNGSDENIDF